MGNIYQLRIQLDGVTNPPIWREVLLSEDTNLYLLHCIIQGAMGWYNCHLHQFIHTNQYYGIPHPDYGDTMKDARKTHLKKLLKKEKDYLHYEYDFGDGWIHRITLERILVAEKDKTYPMLVAGKGGCPPEDCGGIYGYEDLKKIMSNPKHKEYRDMLDWLGSRLDPNDFDLKEHQEAMKESYEEGVVNKGREFGE
jgi:Plasmid pRiA4b ORF-3-like protein